MKYYTDIFIVQAQKKKQEEELSQLRKEVVALQIMKANYEQLVKAHRQGAAAADLRDGDGDTAVPSDVKFEVMENSLYLILSVLPVLQLDLYICRRSSGH